MTGRVLVHRQGSLGDTVIALPSFHLIRASFADSEIRVLTNAPVTDRAPPLFSVLEGSGLIDGYFEYPVSQRDLPGLWRLAGAIRAWQPDTAIYLMRRERFGQVLRDAAFLRGCGIRRIIGLPWTRGAREPLRRGNGLFEREAERLARCLSPLGVIDIEARAGWDLHLTQAERTVPCRIADGWTGTRNYIVLGMGTKQAVNDWGGDNWKSVADTLLAAYPHKLVCVGAAEDHPLCASLMRNHPERWVNLCGMLSVRESAAVIAAASLFIGVDSGPMHLAAAVGTPLVGIFSRHNLPGVWFPVGDHARVLYPDHAGAIPPADIVAAAKAFMPEASALDRREPA